MDQFLDLIDNGKNAAQVLSEFAEAQKQHWPLARDNYEGLESVEVKSFQFDGFRIKVQFNPQRIRSSAAKVDTQSIAERKCFLCNENRPTEQKAIAFGDEFLILVNPYPIFKTHLTISSNAHIPQRFLAMHRHYSNWPLQWKALPCCTMVLKAGPLLPIICIFRQVRAIFYLSPKTLSG